MALLLAEARTNPSIRDFGMHTHETNPYALPVSYEPSARASLVRITLMSDRPHRDQAPNNSLRRITARPSRTK